MSMALVSVKTGIVKLMDKRDAPCGGCALGLRLPACMHKAYGGKTMLEDLTWHAHSTSLTRAGSATSAKVHGSGSGPLLQLLLSGGQCAPLGGLTFSFRAALPAANHMQVE